MPPFLSVIVPVWNAAQYLPQCLDSVLAQTFADWELILVDDGSQDDSAQIFHAYAQRDARVFCLEQPHSGVTSARLMGLKRAQGQYVAFADADDWLEPKMFERLCSAAAAANADIAMAGFYENFPDAVRRVVPALPAGYYAGEAYDANVHQTVFCNRRRNSFCPTVHLWNKIYRRSLAMAIMPQIDLALTVGEDSAFAMGCVLAAKRLVVLPEALYHYRRCNKAPRPDLYVQRLLLWRQLLSWAQVCPASNATGNLNSYFLLLIWLDLRALGSEAARRLLREPEVRQVLRQERSAGACLAWKKRIWQMRLGWRVGG